MTDLLIINKYLSYKAKRLNNSIINLYERLNPNATKLYVSHNVFKSRSSNEYLFLLFEDLLNKSNIDIATIPLKNYPRICLKRLKGEKSIFHQHWYQFNKLNQLPTYVWKLVWIYIFKLCGVSIVWTIHNKYPHNTRYLSLNKKFRRVLAKIADVIHVHCFEAITTMKPILAVPESKFYVIEHPNYKTTILDQITAKRKLLELYSCFLPVNFISYNRIFLMFGQVSKYKGILEVINIWNEGSIQDSLLVIAGMTKPGEEDYTEFISATVSKNKSIVFINKLIPNNHIDILFNATDVIIFNYTDILTSGGVKLSLAYGKKVLAPDLGCIKELFNQNLIKFTDNKSLKSNMVDLKYTNSSPSSA